MSKKSKNYNIFILLAVLIIGLSLFYWQQEQIDESPSSNEEGQRYVSESLGLTFSYPSSTNGSEVTLEEDLNTDQNEEIGTVSLHAEGNALASLTVLWIDSPTQSENMADHLTALLLPESESCRIELNQTEDDKEIFMFKSSESPLEGDLDDRCQLLSNIYVFEAQPNKALVLSTGQTPPFSAEETEAFLDSIQLSQ